MCGVLGFIDLAGGGIDEREAPATTAAMLERIRHRGPDEAGYFVDACVALGAVRLSIIDLATGQQPMTDASRRWVIAYNGETYNYRELRAELEALGHVFATTSDTEVVLHAYMAWGVDGIARLNGAFAFAIYDRETRALVLARDRYGERPLFYTEHDGKLLFASEMKAFLAYPGVEFAFDPATLASIFTVWTPLADQTAFRDMRQLPVGHWLKVEGAATSRATLTTSAFAGIDDGREPFRGGAGEAIERTRALLADAVRIRLRSDVEVATYLSGGLDSAITTQLALENGLSHANSFSITFEDPEFDESSDQLGVARHLGTRHTALHVRAGDIARAFPEAIWHAEVPVFRTAFVPMFLLSRRVHEAGIKVVLTGEGSDESFLGYDIFKETAIRAAWSTHRDLDALGKLYPYLPHFGGSSQKALAAVFEQFSKEKRAGLFSHELRFHNSLFGLRFLNGGLDGHAAVAAYVAANAADFDGRDAVERAQWLEWRTLLPGYLLSTQGDRMSMANAVETRCPFLDPRVVAWAAGLPCELKMGPGNDEKWILKRAFEDALPTRVLTKPKQPYRAPDLTSFLGTPEADYTAALLSEVELTKIDALNAPFCQTFLQKVRAAPPGEISQRDNQAFVLLLSVALLHRMFVERKSPPPLDLANSPARRVAFD